MTKAKQAEISVTTIFSGKQDGRQAFVDLIIRRIRQMSEDEQRKSLESGLPRQYNGIKVFSDVRVN
jgi:hypothetical protein